MVTGTFPQESSLRRTSWVNYTLVKKALTQKPGSTMYRSTWLVLSHGERAGQNQVLWEVPGERWAFLTGATLAAASPFTEGWGEEQKSPLLQSGKLWQHQEWACPYLLGQVLIRINWLLNCHKPSAKFCCGKLTSEFLAILISSTRPSWEFCPAVGPVANIYFYCWQYHRNPTTFSSLRVRTKKGKLYFKQAMLTDMGSWFWPFFFFLV